MRLRFIAFLLLTVMSGAGLLCAQGFTINLELPKGAEGKTTLLLYDGNSQPRVLRPYATRTGMAVRGELSEPLYAELRVGDSKVLPFFVEAGEMTVRYNAENPEQSAVTGSRSNSMMRYQLEQCRESAKCESMKDFVLSNAASPIAPYLTECYLFEILEFDTLKVLYAKMKSAGAHGYHFTKLGRRLERLSSSGKGATLGTIIYLGEGGAVINLDTMLCDTSRNALLIGAKWCSQCKEIEKRLKRLSPAIHTVVIDMDNDKMGWDALFMQKLDIEHIPYLFLIDSSRRIIARDIRIWELERMIESE